MTEWPGIMPCTSRSLEGTRIREMDGAHRFVLSYKPMTIRQADRCPHLNNS
jgi:hypothetical protein